jgi:hypothetical protein
MRKWAAVVSALVALLAVPAASAHPGWLDTWDGHRCHAGEECYRFGYQILQYVCHTPRCTLLSPWYAIEDDAMYDFRWAIYDTPSGSYADWPS